MREAWGTLWVTRSSTDLYGHQGIEFYCKCFSVKNWLYFLEFLGIPKCDSIFYILYLVPLRTVTYDLFGRKATHSILEVNDPDKLISPVFLMFLSFPSHSLHGGIIVLNPWIQGIFSHTRTFITHKIQSQTHDTTVLTLKQTPYPLSPYLFPMVLFVGSTPVTLNIDANFSFFCSSNSTVLDNIHWGLTKVFTYPETGCISCCSL